MAEALTTQEQLVRVTLRVFFLNVSNTFTEYTCHSHFILVLVICPYVLSRWLFTGSDVV